MIDSLNQEKRIDCGVASKLNQKRQVSLKTCADVYGHWRSYKRLYKRAPIDGVEFQIDYIDTGLLLDEEERSRAPIALALHGAPGSYHDFSLLINHLTKQKVRVIAPNFPEYIATVKTKVLFRHSADEKAAYLRDFLKAINVKKIDLLISHSSAIFPTLLILLNANNEAIALQRTKKQNSKQEKLDIVQTNEAGKDLRKERLPDEDETLECGPEQDATNPKAVYVDALGELGGRQLGHNLNDNFATPGEDVPQRHQEQARGREDEQNEQLADRRADDNDDEACDDELAGESDIFEDATDDLDGNNNNRRKVKDKAAGQQMEETLNSRLDGTGSNTSAARHHKASVSEGAEDYLTRKSAQLKPAAKRPKRCADIVVKFDEPIEIKAVALFNPAGHRLPKSMKPTWFKCGSVHIYQHKLGRSLFRKFGPAFLTVIGVPVRVDNMDNVMLSATVMRNSKCQRVVKQLEQLSQMKIPTLLVFSENDKLIEKEIFYEMTQFMRLNPKNFDVFNNDGDIELSQSLMDDWIRVMVFKAGGHYAYSNYAKTVNRAVSDLLGRVTTTTTTPSTTMTQCETI